MQAGFQRHDSQRAIGFLDTPCFHDSAIIFIARYYARMLILRHAISPFSRCRHHYAFITRPPLLHYITLRCRFSAFIHYSAFIEFSPLMPLRLFSLILMLFSFIDTMLSMPVAAFSD
jgi:hypothetical protein